MKLSKKICLACAVCLLAVASIAVINPGTIGIGEIVNHPYSCIRYIFPL